MINSSLEVRIFLLGGFRVEKPDGTDITPSSKKSRALIAYLALSEFASASRDKLALIAWSTRGTKQARDSLRQTLSSIRKHQNRLNHSWLNLSDGEIVSIKLDKTWIDVLEVIELLKIGSDAEIERVIELYRGDPLDLLHINDPEFERWIADERAHLKAQIETCIIRQIHKMIDAGNLEPATTTAQFLLTLDSSNEEVHRQLIRIHSARGDNAAAVRQFHVLKAALKSELDVEPSAETVHLFQAIKCGQAVVTPTAVVSVTDAGSEATPIVEKHPQIAALDHSETRVAILPLEATALDASLSTSANYLSQNLVNALSRFRWLSVLGQFAAKNLLRGQTDVLELGRDLKIEYLVDGTLICSHDGLRITVELIYCETAQTVWADNLPCDIANNLVSLDEIAPLVASMIENQIRLHQANLASRRALKDLSPQMMVMRATPLIFQMNRNSLCEAGNLINHAMDLDPSNSNATAWRAFIELIKIGQGWTKDPPLAIERIEWLTRLAIQLDPNNCMAIALRGHVESFVLHEFDQALISFERALRLNCSDAMAWAFSALTYCYIGETREALLRLNRYRALSPTDPYGFFFDTAFCLAHSLSGNHEAAIRAGKCAISGNPHFFAAYRPTISSLAHCNRIEEARTYLGILLENEPFFSIEWMRTKYPPINDDQVDNYILGLQRAGVPKN